MKRIINVFCMLVLAIGSAMTVSAASNKLYRTMPAESTLYDKNEIGKKELLKVLQGDTLHASAATEAYLIENEGKEISYIPVEYRGIKGWVATDEIYPIKALPTDTLTHLSVSAADDLEPIERFARPAIDWALNRTENHMTWLYALFIALGVSLLFGGLSSVHKAVRLPALILSGLALVAASGAEIMYILAYPDHLLWFLKPSVAGGWWKVILNFLILAVTFTVQCGLYYGVWALSFNDILPLRKDQKDDEDVPEWINGLSMYPLGLGVVLMVMYLIDAFTGNDWTAVPYLVAFGTLVIPAVCGMVYQFIIGQWFRGIVFPIIYVAAAPGITITVFMLSIVILLVIVAGIVIGLVIALGVGAIAGIFSGSSNRRVTGYTSDGRKVSGWRGANGTVLGDDGRTYIDKTR